MKYIKKKHGIFVMEVHLFLHRPLEVNLVLGFSCITVNYLTFNNKG